MISLWGFSLVKSDLFRSNDEFFGGKAAESVGQDGSAFEPAGRHNVLIVQSGPCVFNVTFCS